MKKIILLTLVLVFILGCTAAPKFICPDGETIVDDKSKCPSSEAEAEPETVMEPVVVEEKDGSVPKTQPVEKMSTGIVPTEKSADGDLQKILARIDKVTSYEFTHQYGSQEVMKYTVVGDKIKITLMYGNPIYDKYGYYDRVLLDTREKTAVAYCVERSACELEDKKIAKNVPYDEFEMPVDPIALVNSIESAEIVGELTCDDDRACTVIKFTQDGEEVEAHIDNYYGFPYYWLKGDVEHTFSGVVYIPRNPEAKIPDIVEKII